MAKTTEFFVGFDVSRRVMPSLLRKVVAMERSDRMGFIYRYGVGAATCSKAGRSQRTPSILLRTWTHCYGLKRQIEALGHSGAVVAPSLIPRRPGERVKTIVAMQSSLLAYSG